MTELCSELYALKLKLLRVDDFAQMDQMLAEHS